MMDNPLTPNKIQRLMKLAEDKSFNLPGRHLLNDDLKRLPSQTPQDKSTANTSSGILDLERIEGFGDSAIDNVSLIISSHFNPGEMTGRSTGAEDPQNKCAALGTTQVLEAPSRNCIALDSITNEMNKQTIEICDIMRHSIATNYTFHSQRDLTADEASFARNEGQLPILPNQQSNFDDNMSYNNNRDLSIGAFFKSRCPDFGKILANTYSPDRPSITEVSHIDSEPIGNSTNIYKMDQTLDSIPVKQSQNTDNSVSENHILNNMASTKTFEKPNTNEIIKTENQNLFGGRIDKQNNVAMSKLMDKRKYVPPTTTGMNVIGNHKSVMSSSSNPTDILLRNLQSSLRVTTEDTEGEENSISISKIADFIGSKSSASISVTEMLQLNNPRKMNKKPLGELHMNKQLKKIDEVQLTRLKDTKSTATANSADSVNSVIMSLDKLKINESPKDVPAVIITQHTIVADNMVNEMEEIKEKPVSVRSRSPSSKSRSTLCTVQENCTSFKLNDSPLQSSKGEVNTSHVSSPNVEYKELDKSVNWHEILQHRRVKNDSLAKEQWATITSTITYGFVGISFPVTITITTLIDSWLTARFQFDELPYNGDNFTFELPRLPLLLSPGKTEQFTLYVTSTSEITTSLPFTIFLKDASIDRDVEQKGSVVIDIKMPELLAISCDGDSKVVFPPIQEKTSFNKIFILISECPVDVQVELSVVEGESMFSIKNVQEIRRSQVNQILTNEHQGSIEDVSQGTSKTKPLTKQLCRICSRNAIKVTITFNGPQLSDKQLHDAEVSFNGTLNVNLFGVSKIIKTIHLIGTVGLVNLVVKIPDAKLHLTREPTDLTLLNTGSIPGMFFVKVIMSNTSRIPFKYSPSKFEIRPSSTKTISLSYTGPEDKLIEAILSFEDVTTRKKINVAICGGSDRYKKFPIRTNHNVLSWIRTGRKELSMKNGLDIKVYVRCHITGDGFVIDLPGMESRSTYVLPLGPNECRPLPVSFSSNSCTPQHALLHLVCDKNSNVSRTVRLYGCASESPLRWSRLVTYGDMALVRAVNRTPVDLTLYNKSAMPAFVLATVQFNLQFRCVSEYCVMEGGRKVVPGRSRHAVRVIPPWARVERRARHAAANGTALAMVTLLTGAEITRRRIIKILKDASNGELDTSPLPEHLRGLAAQFEGEDPSLDNMLAQFKETKSSLNELIGGLHEMTAQIDLPQDFADEPTIIITDDTVIEHHTLCE